MIVRALGVTGYEATWRAMQRFTDVRDAHTEDELWDLLNQSWDMPYGAARIALVEVTSGSRVTSASANNPVSLSMSARLTAAMSLIGPRSCCRLCSSAG